MARLARLNCSSDKWAALLKRGRRRRSGIVVALQGYARKVVDPGVDLAVEPHRLARNLARAREGSACHQPPDRDKAQTDLGEHFRLREQPFAFDRWRRRLSGCGGLMGGARRAWSWLRHLGPIVREPTIRLAASCSRSEPRPGRLRLGSGDEGGSLPPPQSPSFKFDLLIVTSGGSAAGESTAKCFWLARQMVGPICGTPSPIPVRFGLCRPLVQVPPRCRKARRNGAFCALAALTSR